jgi:hypothetical protein
VVMERWLADIGKRYEDVRLVPQGIVTYLGGDLGQVRDPTALAVLEKAMVAGEWDAALWAYRMKVEYRLIYLERVPLGTPYPEVVDRIKRVMGSRSLNGRKHLVVDATGPGRPVVDLLWAAGLPGGMSAVTITGGDKESYSDGYYRVPKKELIVGLQVMLQMGELEIASGVRDGAALVRELGEMRVTEAGWRSGAHDDLVFAVGLAAWGARRGR